ncbi:hypothetical protein ACIRPX_17930 [Streptomyces sp. NPDC101225]|uniref:hypothetical protein n=1 Tax=Streptomyces sp. NPDC101225 TaxID=3366135 RepID=UPI00380E4424
MIGTEADKVPKSTWTPALDAKGEPREDAALVEITDLLDLGEWPPGLRVTVRREPVHPTCARDLKPSEIATGFRYQAIATNTAGRQLQWPDDRHRAHAHIESGIRRSKSLTLARLPSFKFALNQAWCTLLALASDLLSWLQLLALDGKLTRPNPPPSAANCSTSQPSWPNTPAVGSSSSTRTGPPPTARSLRGTGPNSSL